MSTAKSPTRPPVRIALRQNKELDWTPAAVRVHPRIVKATGATLSVEVQEASRGPRNEPILIVGAWEGSNDQFWIELRPSQVDELIDLLSAARDRAHAVGMPCRPPRGKEVIS
jgi:hypothetical protein